MKLGIFGGTFNPIHNGHLSIAFKVIKFLTLDKIFFMPNKIPPHKNKEDILDEKFRFDMLSIAIKEYECFDIECYELKNDTFSYTYKSLEYLNQLYKEHDLFFIIGSDSFVNFDKWKNIESIFKNSNIVVYLRDKTHSNLIKELKKNYEKIYNCKIYLFFGKILDISSTEIREKIFFGEDVSKLLPKKVYEYINEKNLYVGN